MKVRVGAVVVAYRTVLRFVELDEAARRAALTATGAELRGQGSVGANVVSSLTEDAGTTTVLIDTQLSITGKVAQIGRGVMEEVSNKLIGQFAACLQEHLLTGQAAAVAGAHQQAPARPPAQPMNLVSLATGPILRRVLPTTWVRSFAKWWRLRRASGNP